MELILFNPIQAKCLNFIIKPLINENMQALSENEKNLHEKGNN